MPFVEHDNVSQTLAFDGAYYSFGIWILPWRSWRANDFFDAHVRDSLLEEVAVDSVAITNQKPRCFFVRKGLDDLLRSPFGRWMLSHVEMNQLPPIVAKNDEREKDPKCCCWHRKEVNTDDVAEVIIQKRSPGLRWRLSMPNHVLVHGRFGNVVPEQL